jgi:hypothetical protein
MKLIGFVVGAATVVVPTVLYKMESGDVVLHNSRLFFMTITSGGAIGYLFAWIADLKCELKNLYSIHTGAVRHEVESSRKLEEILIFIKFFVPLKLIQDCVDKKLLDLAMDWQAHERAYVTFCQKGLDGIDQVYQDENQFDSVRAELTEKRHHASVMFNGAREKALVVTSLLGITVTSMPHPKDSL